MFLVRGGGIRTRPAAQRGRPLGPSLAQRRLVRMVGPELLRRQLSLRPKPSLGEQEVGRGDVVVLVAVKRAGKK